MPKINFPLQNITNPMTSEYNFPTWEKSYWHLLRTWHCSSRLQPWLIMTLIHCIECRCTRQLQIQRGQLNLHHALKTATQLNFFRAFLKNRHFIQLLCRNFNIGNSTSKRYVAKLSYQRLYLTDELLSLT